MKTPSRPSDEPRRLEALREYRLHETTPEGGLEDLTVLAARICEAPGSMVALVGEHRLWFKSGHGLPSGEDARDLSFSAHAILQPDLMVVPDAAQDDRFADNPLVTGAPFIRFYAGMPLRTPSGQALGALCVIDRRPRELAPGQQDALRRLGRQVMALLELRRQRRELAESEERLRAIIQHEPECVKVVSPEGRLLEMNPAGLAMIEADRFEQVRGRPLLDLVAPEHRPAFRELHARVVAGGSGSLVFEAVGLRGTRRWLETRAGPLRDGRGGVTALLGITRDVTDQRHTETALAESEARYRTLFENAPDGLLIADAESRYLDANPSMCRMLGYRREELVGLHAADIVVAEEVPHIGPALRTIHARSVHQREWRFRRKDGSSFTAEVTATLMPDGNLLAAIRDVTPRKEAEARVRQLNRTYAVLSDINQMIVRERDPRAILEGACRIAVGQGGFLLAWVGLVDRAEGRLVLAAQHGAAADTLAVLGEVLGGVKPGCALTQHALETAGHAVSNDIAHDPRAASWREASLARGYHSMVSLPLTVAGRSIGTFNLYAGQTGFFDAEELRLLDELALDIAFALESCEHERERRRAEEALRESEARFRQLAENIHEVFWVADPANGQILYISPACEEIWGRSSGEIAAAPGGWRETVHPDDRARIAEAPGAGLVRGDHDETYRILRPDGTVRWIQTRAFPVRNPAGEIVRVVGTAEDITGRRQLEEQLRQAQKMEAIGQLAGGVAHDFNNILAAIMMQADLATADPSLSPDTRELIDDIKAAAERAASLTRQLLAFSRRQVMQPRRLDLNEIVASLAKMLLRILGEDVRLQLGLHSRRLVLRADPGMLDQVLLNLVVNARDAMPGGGLLTIETGEHDFTAEQAASFADAAPGRHVWLRVADTGTGIAPERLPRIFEPFFTTKEPGKGTGLGLATVFGIVRQHGGWVAVESEPGRGTTFQVFLPVTEQPGTPPDEAPAKPSPQGGTETVLLVEDEPAVRLLTRIVLERHGYQVLEAPSGVAALRVWDRHADTIDLLFTDIVMPEGVNGRELANRLQTLKPGLRVVFTSGYSADIAGRELSLKEGWNFIQKPSSPQALLETVRRCLDA